MKITKLGHCCMLIEADSLRILTDPGGWSDFKQNDLANIDIVLITHERGDHLHMDSVKKIISNNPNVKIITNTGVGKLLEEQSILFEKIEDGQSDSFEGIQIEGFGKIHAEVYETFGQVQNTGYFINNKFFYPGDALTNPQKDIEILALPVAGPWVKSKEVVDYAKELKPQIAFPVHDGMLAFPGPYHFVPGHFLASEMKWITQDDLRVDLVIEL